MSILKSKSQKAKANQNISAEMEDNRSQPSIAVALSAQRHSKKRKKMSEGGMAAIKKENYDDARSTKLNFEDAEGMKMEFDGVRGKDEEEGPLKLSNGGSVAQSIMRKRKMADGGMVDLEEASEEHSNMYDDLNEAAADHAQYDDSQLSDQPINSNQHGHAVQDELDRSIVAAIRRKMAAKQ